MRVRLKSVSDRGVLTTQAAIVFDVLMGGNVPAIGREYGLAGLFEGTGAVWLEAVAHGLGDRAGIFWVNE